MTRETRPDADSGKQIASQNEEARALLREGANAGLLGELLHFLRLSGKWWLAPVVLSLLLLATILVLGSTGVAPLIYALF